MSEAPCEAEHCGRASHAVVPFKISLVLTQQPPNVFALVPQLDIRNFLIPLDSTWSPANKAPARQLWSTLQLQWIFRHLPYLRRSAALRRPCTHTRAIFRLTVPPEALAREAFLTAVARCRSIHRDLVPSSSMSASISLRICHPGHVYNSDGFF
jgi:hypothetical protein